jgi:hypothetical protein
MMNLVAILVPFLLMTLQLAALAAIDTLVDPGPQVGGGSEARTSPEVVLWIRADGLELDAGTDGGRHRFVCTPPCEAAGHDYSGLEGLLRELATGHPERQEILLVPDPDVPYEVLVRILDILRGDAPTTAAEEPRRPLFRRPRLAPSTPRPPEARP